MTAALAAPAPSLLDALGALLDRQAQAILEGRADDLAPLDAAIQMGLRQLAASGWRPRNPAEVAALRALQQRARAGQAMLARRQMDVQQVLDALGQGSESLQHTQSQRLYASAGRMGAPVLRGQHYLSA